MKILHTSDWHLNDRLGQIQRQPDIKARLIEIAGYLESEQVDTMLVSGDLFSNFTQIDEVRGAVTDINEIFSPFLLRGGTILGISGNHDSEEFFNLFREMMSLASPVRPPADEPYPSGRLYLFPGWSYMRLADRSGQQIQFTLLPYPTISRYLKGEKVGYSTMEEMNRLLKNALIQRLNYIRGKNLREDLPSILVSHINVRGSKVHNLYQIRETQDILFDPVELPLEWTYVACGHIHDPQPFPNRTNARYSGSIERFDFGEAKDEKSVVLLEVSRGKLVREPHTLPLHATSLHRVDITKPREEIPTLPDRYPDAAQAIVECNFTYRPGEDNPEAIAQDLRRLFPRCCRLNPSPEGNVIKDAAHFQSQSTDDVPGTVRAYLQETLANHADREDLLALAEELMVDL
ncbi:MAG: metallophosphoesterase [Anaerolineaceae bacterium]|nr:metallophosphoesterase [Anaerolineaceae bacterium]